MRAFLEGDDGLGSESQGGHFFLCRVDCYHDCWLWFHEHLTLYTSTIARRELVMVSYPIIRSCNRIPGIDEHVKSNLSNVVCDCHYSSFRMSGDIWLLVEHTLQRSCLTLLLDGSPIDPGQTSSPFQRSPTLQPLLKNLVNCRMDSKECLTAHSLTSKHVHARLDK